MHVQPLRKMIHYGIGVLRILEDIPNLIKLYIDYYNYERPSYALNYKTPIQYKIESGF